MQAPLMKKALAALDVTLRQAGHREVRLLIGGGGAFALAYQIPLHTADIDGVPFQSEISRTDLDACTKAVAKELQISPDWLNPYFETFLGCLPADYGDRIKEVYAGKALRVYALGLSDLLIMKCFAGREKDMPHAKVLIKKGAEVSLAERHIHHLIKKNYPRAQQALDFLIEAEEQVGR